MAQHRPQPLAFLWIVNEQGDPGQDQAFALGWLLRRPRLRIHLD
jgi:hypothetical protein